MKAIPSGIRKSTQESGEDTDVPTSAAVTGTLVFSGPICAGGQSGRDQTMTSLFLQGAPWLRSQHSAFTDVSLTWVCFPFEFF